MQIKGVWLSSQHFDLKPGKVSPSFIFIHLLEHIGNIIIRNLDYSQATKEYRCKLINFELKRERKLVYEPNVLRLSYWSML